MGPVIKRAGPFLARLTGLHLRATPAWLTRGRGNRSFTVRFSIAGECKHELCNYENFRRPKSTVQSIDQRGGRHSRNFQSARELSHTLLKFSNWLPDTTILPKLIGQNAAGTARSTSGKQPSLCAHGASDLSYLPTVRPSMPNAPSVQWPGRGSTPRSLAVLGISCAPCREFLRCVLG